MVIEDGASQTGNRGSGGSILIESRQPGADYILLARLVVVKGHIDNHLRPIGRLGVGGLLLGP